MIHMTRYRCYSVNKGDYFPLIAGALPTTCLHDPRRLITVTQEPIRL